MHIAVRTPDSSPEGRRRSPDNAPAGRRAMTGRVDRASRVVAAPRPVVWQAFAEAGLLARWLPPEGMTCRVEVFEPRTGGAYRLVLSYLGGGAGKTTSDSDVTEGRFVGVTPPVRIVQTVRFRSSDPAFAGEMRVAWTLSDAPEGTRVAVEASDVPPGISPEDHAAGLDSSLANLARLVEGGGFSRR